MGEKKRNVGGIKQSGSDIYNANMRKKEAEMYLIFVCRI